MLNTRLLLYTPLIFIPCLYFILTLGNMNHQILQQLGIDGPLTNIVFVSNVSITSLNIYKTKVQQNKTLLAVFFSLFICFDILRHTK